MRNKSNQETIEDIKREGIPVVIFGAGIVGEVLLQACSNAGIRVECFCDNNINKVSSSICNKEIIHTSHLKSKYKDAIFLISAADIKDVVDQLHGLGYQKWYGSSLLLRDFDVSRYQFSASPEFVEFAVSTCLLCHDSYLTPDKLFLRSVDIIITERCSLKCLNCANLMQYYKKPQDCDTNEIFKSIDAFCGLVDEVNEFRVIGGEPFMNKEIHLVIRRLINEPKVRKIVIYTNGTIVPKDHQIEHLKDSKVLFIITDYGKLSKNIEPLTQTLQQNNIAYYILKVQGWSDCATITKHHRSIEEQKEIFKNCCAKSLITISDGRIYRCPFAANAARLNAVPDFDKDYIDIFQEINGGIEKGEIKKKIRMFLLEKDFLETCDFCKGRPLEAPAEITPAIQTDKPLEYEQYC